jgi:hypothetical protein
MRVGEASEAAKSLWEDIWSLCVLWVLHVVCT